MIIPLSQVPFDDLMDCFNAAFKDYYVEMPSDPAYYKTRWTAAKVDYDLSFGKMVDGKLAGFIVHAIGKRKRKRIAFNTGTGVLPEHRGQGMTESIYEAALPILKEAGIQRCELEVITENAPAIRSYQKIGFEVQMALHCYKGDLDFPENPDLAIEELDYDAFVKFALPNQKYCAWDNHIASLKGGDTQYFSIYHHGTTESYFALRPETGYLAQFELLGKDPKAWERLFTAVNSLTPSVKINNVDARQKDKLAWLGRLGLAKTVDQFEMGMKL